MALNRLATDRKPSTTFIATTIDGKLVPHVIDEKLYFNTGKESYEELTEDTPKGNVYFGAELKKDELYEAIEAFRKTATIKESNKYPQAEFEISGCQKWSDVEQTMRDAKVEYEKRHKGKTVAAIDNFLQTIGNSGKTFQAWMDLLPNGDYSSVICGSFKLVLNAVIGFSKVRDMVFINLAEIPRLLDTAQDFLKMNNIYQSLKLHQSFSRLCTAILIAFEDILRWLKENRWKHISKALFLSDGYEEQMTEKMGAVKQQSEQVRIQAEICSHYLLGNIDQNVSKQIVQFDGIKVTVEGVKAGVEQLSPIVQSLSSKMKQVADSQGKQGEGIIHIKDTLNSMWIFLQAEASKGRQQQLLEEKQRKQRMKQKKSKKLTAEKLLKCINYNRFSVQADVTHVMGYGRASSNQDQERAKHFMGHPRLKTWLTSSSSEFLLANGNTKNDKLSPMSFSCGMLTTSLSSFGGAIPITFFCGMNCSMGTEPKSGAELLMASLLSQLLAGYPWDHDEEGQDGFNFNALFRSDSYSITSVKEWDLEALCSLFTDLLKSLQRDQIVFILIDGINFYEYGDRKDGTVFAIQELYELVRSESLKATCKVLVTSAAQSLAVVRRLSTEVVLKLDRELEREDEGININRRLLQDRERMGRQGKLFRLNSHPDELESEDTDGSEEYIKDSNEDKLGQSEVIARTPAIGSDED